MIRYSDTQSLTQIPQGWKDRADALSTAFRNRRGYDPEHSPIWSEVKPFFMEIQHNKCAYCERDLSTGQSGAIEHDLEHFRPKSEVKTWPPRSRKLTYDFPLAPPSNLGYYWLSYNLENYCAACKRCNSSEKSSYFPTRKPAAPIEADAAGLAQEEPLLIYPIGESDTDPETLITFVGIKPTPVYPPNTYEYGRAQVTIDFFRLATRWELIRQRCRVVRDIYGHCDRLRLAVIAKDESSQKDALQSLEELTSSDSPHAACARCFFKLCQNSWSEATQINQEVRKILQQNRSQPSQPEAMP